MKLTDRDAYAQISELPGVKIVDSSFVKSHLAKGWRGLDYGTRCRYLGLESELYRIMTGFSSKEISYPCEMLCEFRAFGVNLKILYELINDGKEKVNGILKKELNDVCNSFGIVLKNRADLENDILRTNITENYLRDRNDWSSSYLPISIAIGSCEETKKSYGGRYGGGFSRKEHELHDERIFAKALAIARDMPVYILTGDSDFIRMHERFYEESDLLSKLYGFEIPQNDLNIVARFNSSPLLIAQPYEKLMDLNEERVYSFA